MRSKFSFVYLLVLPLGGLALGYVVSSCTSATDGSQLSVTEIPTSFETTSQAVSSASELLGWRPFDLQVSHKREVDEWISLVGRIRSQGKRLQSQEQAAESTVFVALIRRTDTGLFTLVDISLGDEDAEFIEWIEEYDLPSGLFMNQPLPDTQWGGE